MSFRYLGGAFDVESLVENLLGQLSGNQGIAVNVYDVTNSSDPLIMYGHQSLESDMSLKHMSRLDFGDPFRRHEMICGYVLRILKSFLSKLIVQKYINKNETWFFLFGFCL